MSEPVAVLYVELNSWDEDHPSVTFRRLEVLQPPPVYKIDPMPVALRRFAAACNAEAEYHEGVEREMEQSAAPGTWMKFGSSSRVVEDDSDQ